MLDEKLSEGISSLFLRCLSDCDVDVVQLLAEVEELGSHVLLYPDVTLTTLFSLLVSRFVLDLLSRVDLRRSRLEAALEAVALDSSFLFDDLTPLPE